MALLHTLIFIFSGTNIELGLPPPIVSTQELEVDRLRPHDVRTQPRLISPQPSLDVRETIQGMLDPVQRFQYDTTVVALGQPQVDPLLDLRRPTASGDHEDGAAVS